MRPEDVHYSGGQDPMPLDRLTEIADVGRKAMYADDRWQEDDKLIISIAGRREDGRLGGGLFIHGYGADDEDLEQLRKEFPQWDSWDEERRERAVRASVAAHVVAVLVEHAESLLAEVTGMPVKIVPVHPARIDQVMPFLANVPN